MVKLWAVLRKPKAKRNPRSERLNLATSQVNLSLVPSPGPGAAAGASPSPALGGGAGAGGGADAGAGGAGGGGAEAFAAAEEWQLEDWPHSFEHSAVPGDEMPVAHLSFAPSDISHLQVQCLSKVHTPACQARCCRECSCTASDGAMLFVHHIVNHARRWHDDLNSCDAK